MDTEQFYPTPKELLEKIFKDTDWRTVSSILEPSAGNGDICDYIMDAADKYPYYNRSLDIDCIGINENRRAALKGKNYRVIYDGFIRFQTYKQYDLIAMNPPFAEGERHLLKALEMQKNGGCVMCILNAETLRNPYTKEKEANVATAFNEADEKNFANQEQNEGGIVDFKRNKPSERTVPITEKILLTLEEAALLTGIGQNKLREISNEDNCPFVLWNGSKRMFKREKLISFLNTVFSI